MRDGVQLLADVHRPDADGRFPALIAASPYPRQIQDLGAPAGFIEAGATDFWVPRGYVHVIANVRGTGGSGGTFGFFDAQERRDMHDLVEWAAAQPWCDGNVGMIGISYFAMTQLEAAVERPPHLKAIFPVAVTADLYEAAMHHGLLSSSFVTPFLSMIGLTSERSDKLWRSAFVELVRRVLNTPRAAPQVRHDERRGGGHDDARSCSSCRTTRIRGTTCGWTSRSSTRRATSGGTSATCCRCSRRSTSRSTSAATGRTCRCICRRRSRRGKPWRTARYVRMGMLGQFGLTWPWESLHIEALAWFDHWLKGRDTGILDGPPIRYFLPGADEWRTADTWPPAAARHRELALRADGALADDEGASGRREFMVLGAGLNRAKPSPIDPPSTLTWTSAPLDQALDVVGDIELRLVASATAIDTAWIVTLQDVAPDGQAEPVTAGWLRASLREVDEAASRPGAPVLPCRNAAGGTDRRGRRVSNPVGAQRPSVRGRPSHPAGAHQRRPGPVDAGDHELPARQRRHQQPEHRARRRRGCCCRCSLSLISCRVPT